MLLELVLAMAQQRDGLVLRVVGVTETPVDLSRARRAHAAAAHDEEEIENANLDNEFDFLATPASASASAAAWWLPRRQNVLYEWSGENDPEDDALETNSLIISGGIKWRF